MSPKDWIAMGDELRVELDRLELLACAWVVQRMPFLPDGWLLDAEERLARAPDETRKAVQRSVMHRPRRWFSDSLVKLQSHGRCLSWPAKPWAFDHECIDGCDCEDIDG